MSLSRRISEHRPKLVLLGLVVLSVISLASGTQASLLHEAVSTTVSVAAYPFLKLLHVTQNSTQYLGGFVTDYDGPRRENALLQERLTRMNLHTGDYTELRRENERLRNLLDFERSQPVLDLQPVEVIERFKGMLIIDRGAVNGVRESMCVVNDVGVVGMVVRVDPFSSNVITLFNTDCMVGGMIERTRAHGIVHGTASDLDQLCTMQYIDLKDDVLPGDTVVTSPDSVFPAGLTIGRVTAVHDTAALWKWAEVEPAVDPYKLDEVFLVLKAQAPVSAIAGTPAGAETVPPPPDALDTRPIQQRYAP